MEKDFPVIAVEEHYWDRELSDTFSGRRTSDEALLERLFDRGALRIAEMDAAGIDMQVLSHAQPAVQHLPADRAPAMARVVNDRLAAFVAARPDRFAALGTIPTSAPQAAADELERSVRELGFRGAMIHGLSTGEFLDLPKYRPIFARAEALGVPIYLHPAVPHPDVLRAYYADYEHDYRMIIRAAWGFTVECATQAIRLVLSGVFDEHPRLQIVLGHLGESLPFLLWRIQHTLSRPGQKQVDFRRVFAHNFHVTTSGFFSTPALRCVMDEIGVERIMFAVDWPFVGNEAGVAWLRDMPVTEADRTRIASGNARALFGL